jgi:triacylglycerol lipase
MSRQRAAAAVIVPFLVAAIVAATLVAVALTDSSPPAADGRRVRHDPVLLVHGFDGSSESWHVMERRLRAAGYRAQEIRAVSYDSHASNVDAAHVIAQAVDQLRAENDVSRVDVVSHSMGAIASRVFVEELGGAPKVDAWVSLAGVNTGTVWAYGCALIESCREMMPGSPLLDLLAHEFTPEGDVRFATWWSPWRPGHRALRGRDDLRGPEHGDVVPGALGPQDRPHGVRSGRTVPRGPSPRHDQALTGSAAASQSSLRITLPSALRGSSSTTRTRRGRL